MKKLDPNVKYYRYEVVFRQGDGKDRKVVVWARHEMEALILAGAIKYDVVIFSVTNLDL